MLRLSNGAGQLRRTQLTDQAPFHLAGIPAILVAWRGASEGSWPDEIAHPVEPYRLGVTGRMVTLAPMTLAR